MNIENIIETELASEAINNMKEFMIAANFKKATLTYIASKIPELEIMNLRKSFI